MQAHLQNHHTILPSAIQKLEEIQQHPQNHQGYSYNMYLLNYPVLVGKYTIHLGCLGN